MQVDKFLKPFPLASLSPNGIATLLTKSDSEFDECMIAPPLPPVCMLIPTTVAWESAVTAIDVRGLRSRMLGWGGKGCSLGINVRISSFGKRLGNV